MKHNVVFEVVNCDGNKVFYSYKDISDFINEWNKEDDMPNIPMLDDLLIHAEVDGIVYGGKIMLDALNAIAYAYGFTY